MAKVCLYNDDVIGFILFLLAVDPEYSQEQQNW